MNKIEKKPTKDNLIEMLKSDAIGRNQYIRNFLEMLDNVEDNFTIFINGDWGTGKTFFVKQIHILLTYYNQFIKKELNNHIEKLDEITGKESFCDLKLEKNYVPIYYNAWNNDSHIDPVKSIIFNIIKEHNFLKDYQKESKDILNKIASVLDMVNVFSNGSVKDLVETFSGNNIAPEIVTMENLKETMNTLLDQLLVERGDKLVIFIDELDRCNPIYAIKLLERIKHFFEDENIIFVFSVNVNELTNTISNFYGQNFDSHRYLNKFFDVSIDLPQIDITSFMEFLGLPRNSRFFNLVVYQIINRYHFTMRDCIRYYQSISVVNEYANTFSNFRFSDEKGREVINIFFLPMLLGIKIIDLKTYIEIINGNGFNKFSNFIKEIEILYEGVKNYMAKDEQGKVTEKSFDEQLLGMYDAIFNHGDNYKEYSNI